MAGHYKAGFTIDQRDLNRNVAGFQDQVHQYVTLATDFAAEQTVAQMKLKAPWTDRTGAARGGLHSVTRHNKRTKKHNVTFSHGVDYGIWLEVANSGKYAIIMPTVLAVGKEIMSALDGMLNHLDKKPTPRPRIDMPNKRPAKSSKGAAARAQAKYAAAKANKSKTAAKAKATKKTSTTSRTKRS